MVSKLGGAATGALSGAGTGAALGSVVPGIGTAIGAGVGGLVGAIGGFLSRGHKDKFKQLPTLSPQQQQFQNQLLQNLQSGGEGQNYGLAQDYIKGILSGNPDAYNQFAAPYLQNFEQQIVPRLAERFAGIGGGLGGGTMGSSGFGQAIGGAGAQLQAQLAQLHAGLRQQASQQAMGQYNQQAQLGLGTRGFENVYQPGTLGFGASALSGISSGVGQGLGQRLGYNMGQGFGGQNAPSSPMGYQGQAGYYDPYQGMMR